MSPSPNKLHDSNLEKVGATSFIGKSKLVATTTITELPLKR